MNLRKERNDRPYAIQITAEEGGAVVGRAYVYAIYNGLHEEPYALLEDVFVEPGYRGKGIGSQLVKEAIKEARQMGCYKMIGTSRHGRADVHAWYKDLGFADYGIEFRMDF